MMEKLTPEQAAVISAYTGILCGAFDDMHKYAEKILDRPVFSSEFGSKAFAEALKDAAKNDFMMICEGVE